MRIKFLTSGITTFFIIILLIAIMAFAFSVWFKEKRSCRDFSSQAQAQAAFKREAGKYKLLDRDHDGKVCESMP